MRDWRFFVGVLWTIGMVGLLGCGDDNRRQTRIPPLPDGSAEVRNKQALEALSRAISQSGAASAYARRAALYLQMNRPQEALADINEALETDGNVGFYHLIRAQIYRQQRQWDRALESAQRAEGLGVDTPTLYLVLGDVLQEKKQYDRAKLYAAKALQMSPYEGEAFYLGGLIAARQGDTASALSNWEKSLSLKPRFAPSYIQLSAIHTALRQYDPALNYSGRGLAYFPKEAKLYYERGHTFHRIARLDSAYRLYQQAIRFEPKAYAAQFQSGLICLKWRANNRAIAHFTEVQKLAPDHPGLRYYQAQAYEQLGQFDKALALLEEQVAANPNDGASRNAIWRLQRRQYGTYGGSFATDGEPDRLTRPGTVLDTTRVRIMTIKPRSRFGASGDSLRR